MYIPIIGILVAVVWGVHEWVVSQSSPERIWFRPGIKALATALLLCLTVLTVRQIGFWSDSYELWSHALQLTENNFVAHDHLGGLLIEQGRTEEANRHFQEAATEAPWDPVSHLALGAAAQDHGDLKDAVEQYRIALRFKNPRLLALTYLNLGVLYRELGDYAAAQQNSQEALRHHAEIFQEVIQQTSEALKSGPAPSGYVRLGFLFEGIGQMDEARSAFERALQIDPRFRSARKALDEIPLARSVPANQPL
jgi:tetratricopeptide (TPR) repeat protein